VKVLYIAEIVGKAGVYAFKQALKELRRRASWDFLIACADGATGSGGLGRNHAAYLAKLGANVLTTGDFCFYKKDLCDNFDKLPYVLRPYNLNQEAPGSGARVYKAGSGKVAVVSLLGQSGFSRLHGSSPHALLPALLARLRAQTPYVIVDFHAQASAEKKALFLAADGLCSAALGSHARVQTADETVLPGGTAIITDAGRTGAQESVGGCDAASRVREYLSGIPDWTRESWERPEAQGVLVDMGEDGRARSIERIRVPVSVDEKDKGGAPAD